MGVPGGAARPTAAVVGEGAAGEAPHTCIGAHYVLDISHKGFLPDCVARKSTILPIVATLVWQPLHRTTVEGGYLFFCGR